MWVLFGSIAMITAIWNVIRTIQKQDPTWFRFISLSFTAFTLCAFHTEGTQWVLLEQWSSLLDVWPTLSKVLWFLTIVSVLVNSISLLQNRDK